AFINRAKPDVQERLIEKYQENDQDDVLDLLYEMNRELVERLYILPGIVKLKQRIGATDAVNLENYLEFLRMCYTSFDWEEGEYVEDGTFVEGLSAAVDLNASNIRRLVDFTVRHLRPIGIGHTPLDRDEALRKYLRARGGIYVKVLTPQHPFVL